MTFDVATRLRQGLTSVSNTQTYVSACRAVGYQDPDLTAHGAQILDWYGSEDGLDLHALDTDRAALTAAADAADEALAVQRDGLGVLTAAWDGATGSQAADFIGRHSTAAVAVVNALRIAADACAALRDTLWGQVDAKVQAAVAIDDRHAGERSAWLAAAGTVVGGAGERGPAVETVTERIVPYVDHDIRTEWVTAMRSATAAASSAYQDTAGRLDATPAVHFDVPGRLSPVDVPVRAPVLGPVRELHAAVPATPAGYSAPGPLSGPPAATSPDVTAPPPAPLAPATTDQPMQPGPAGAPPAGPLPGMPDAGGLSGVLGQIADAIGGLLDGIPDGPSGDSAEPGPEPVEASQEEEDQADDEAGANDDQDAEDPAAQPLPAPAAVGEQTEAAEPSVDVDVAAPPPPEAEPAAPTVRPLEAETAAPLEDRTPCDIAADELPQVGQ